MGLRHKSIEEGAEKAVETVNNLVVEINLPDFKSFGVKEKDFEELARNSVANGSNIDNPRPMAEADYLNVLRKLSSQ
jgi:alcohol dehydrogenase